MEIYTANEIAVIFSQCSNMKDLYDACYVFKWLIKSGYMRQNNELQRMAIERLNQIA